MSSILNGSDIAIIGMAGIFPQAPDIGSFWKNLLAGKECYSDNTRFETGSIKEAQRAGFIDSITLFDNEFFDILPIEARQMDPRQRLFLQTAWQALENSGYSMSDLDGSETGVFAGLSNNQYLELNAKLDKTQRNALLTANASVANRFSYFMNFTGPSMVVETTCSSSAVALHLACRSIACGECGMAVVGGVQILASLNYFIALSRMGVLSRSGRTAALSAQADGFVLGEGAGALVLKPLEQAQKDNDYIYCTIKGVGINYAGRTKHLLSPNPVAQKELITKTLLAAKVDPHSIKQLELNGNAVSITDALEVHSVLEAFRELGATEKEFCNIGTVKNNIGNLDSACCIAGIIKLALSLDARKIAPVINTRPFSRFLKLKNTPFYVSEEAADFPEEKKPVTACLNSFGIGGTNIFMVMEEKPRKEQQETPAPGHIHSGRRLVTFSAKNRDSLLKIVQQAQNRLENTKAINIDNFCCTLNKGRTHFEKRAACIFSTPGELTGKLHKIIAALQDNRDEIQEEDEHIYISADLDKKSKKKKNISFLKLFMGSYDNETERLIFDDQKFLAPFENSEKKKIVIFLDDTLSIPGPDSTAGAYKAAWKRIEQAVSSHTGEEIDLTEYKNSYPMDEEIFRNLQVFTSQAAFTLSLIRLGCQPGLIINSTDRITASLYAAGIISLKQSLCRLIDGRTPDTFSRQPEIEVALSSKSLLEKLPDINTPEGLLLIVNRDSLGEKIGDDSIIIGNFDNSFPPQIKVDFTTNTAYLEGIGRLYTEGAPINFSLFEQDFPGTKAPFGTYCFSEKEFWLTDDE